MTTPEQLLHDIRATDAGRPLVTFYDDASGERAELSAASFGNWTAKTHFLLLDELGLGPGARAFVRLPVHWMSLVVLFGAWFAGLEVVTTPPGADVAFVDDDSLHAAVDVSEVYALALRPWGQGYPGSPPAGTTDFVAAVRPQADAWAAVRAVAAPHAAAWNGSSRSELMSAARARAEDLGLKPAARVLVGAARGFDVVTWLAPLTVGGSLVLVRNASPGADDPRAGQERVTAVVSG